MEHWGEVANHFEAELMGVEERDFRDAVDINCSAIIDTVLGYDSSSCATLAIEEDIGMLSQSEVGGEEYPFTEVRGDDCKKQE